MKTAQEKKESQKATSTHLKQRLKAAVQALS
jgi:hypothetical protein